MPPNDVGPPGRGKPGATPSTGPLRKSGIAKPANHHQGNAQSRLCDTVGVQWRRRRQSSYRLPPLHCGCKDPWPCRCAEPPALTDRALDGWRDAGLHLLTEGWVPLLPIEVCRALWRRGGADRKLAELLDELCGEVAA